MMCLLDSFKRHVSLLKTDNDIYDKFLLMINQYENKG